MYLLDTQSANFIFIYNEYAANKALVTTVVVFTSLLVGFVISLGGLLLRREPLKVKLAVGGVLSGFTLYMGSPLKNLLTVLNGSPSFAFGCFSDVAISYGNFVIRYKIDGETAEMLVSKTQNYFLDQKMPELHSLVLQHKLALVQSLCQKGATSANDLLFTLKMQAARSSNIVVVDKKVNTC